MKQQNPRNYSRRDSSNGPEFYPKPAHSVQSGQGGDNHLTNLDEEEEDIDAQLMMMGRPAPLQTLTHGERAPTRASDAALAKKVNEMESRQKIFEDEIIKRIKEIQRYTKSIHLQVKKSSNQSTSQGESIDRLENQLVQVKTQMNMLQTEPDLSMVQMQIDDIKDSLVPKVSL